MKQHAARREWFSRQMPRVLELATTIAAERGVKVTDVLGPVRGNRAVWDARQELYVEVWRLGFSIKEVSTLLQRDHTTIMYGLRRALGHDAYVIEVLDRWLISPKSYRGKAA